MKASSTSELDPIQSSGAVDTAPHSTEFRRIRSAGDLELRSIRRATFKGLQKGKRVVGALYEANHTWKSVWSKTLIVLYMTWRTYVQVRLCEYSIIVFSLYLTHWAWVIENIYFAYALYLDMCARYAGGKQYLSVVARAFCHCLSELAFILQVVVVLLFWTIVYPKELWRPLSYEMHMHLMGLLLISADYIYRFTGFSMRNHKYILAFAAFYSLFHISAVFGYGKEIYPGMNFRNVRSFATFLFGLSTLVIFHKSAYLLSHWKDVKREVRSFLDVSHFILIRQDSIENVSLREQARRFGRELATPANPMERRNSDLAGTNNCTAECAASSSSLPDVPQ